MKGKRLLAAFLLGVGLCFVPVLGYGEIPGKLVQGKVDAWFDSKVSLLDFYLLEARVDYIMLNAPQHEYVWMKYDMDGSFEKFFKFPEEVRTSDKIVIVIRDIREFYAPDALALVKWSLLELFRQQLKVIFAYIKDLATDMDNDIVALVQTKDQVPLAYFYQGKYHLWEE